MKITKKELIIPAVMTIAVGSFLLSRFTGMIHSRELYQMFLFTREYLCEVCSNPGGIAEYTGRFINQFYYFPALGAIIYALLIWLVQHLTYKNMTGTPYRSLALSITAFAAATWYIVDPGANTGALVCAIFILGASLPVENKPKLSLILGPVLFFACGPTAIIYPIIVWLKTGRRTECAINLTVCAACGAALLLLTEFKADIRFICLMGCITGTIILDKFLPVKSKAVSVAMLIICTISTLCAYFPCNKIIPEIDESFFEYEYLEEQEKWDEIIAKSTTKKPQDALSMQIVNLALAQKGILPDNAFKYKRNKEECIITKEADHHVFPLATAEIFYHLNFPNISQQYWFDLMQSAPGRQKSARAYRRIAECSALSGNLETALKYASCLKHTLFYSKWAKDFKPCAQHYSNDSFFPEMNFEELMIHAFRTKGNYLAFQYAVTYALMAKDLTTFITLIDGFDPDNIPASCQQAFILAWMQRGNSIDGLPNWIDNYNKTLFNNFGKSKKEGWPAGRMYSKFGGSYLFYYIYYKL